MHKILIKFKENLFFVFGIVFFSLFSITHISRPFFSDEIYNRIIINKPFSGILKYSLYHDSQMPLHYFMQKIWGFFAGYSPLSLHFLSMIFGVLTAYFTYLLSNSFIKGHTSRQTVFFLSAFHPLLIFSSSVARWYSLVAFFSVFSTYCLYKYFEKNNVKYAVLLFLSYIIGVYAGYAVMFVGIAHLAVVLLNLKKINLKHLIIGAVLTCITFLPIFKFVLMHKNYPMLKHAVVPVSLLYMYFYLTVVQIIGATILPWRYLLVVFAVSVCLFLIFLNRKKLFEKKNIELSLLILIPLSIMVFSGFHKGYYLAYLTPYFVILFMYLSENLKSVHKKLVLGGILIVFFIANLNYVLKIDYHYALASDNWHAVYNELKENENSLIVVDPSMSGLYFLHQKKLPFISLLGDPMKIYWDMDMLSEDNVKNVYERLEDNNKIIFVDTFRGNEKKVIEKKKEFTGKLEESGYKLIKISNFSYEYLWQRKRKTFPDFEYRPYRIMLKYYEKK